LQQFEHDCTRDLLGHVGHALVEVGQFVQFDEVPRNQLEFVQLACCTHLLHDFSLHAHVILDCDHFLAFGEQFQREDA